MRIVLFSLLLLFTGTLNSQTVSIDFTSSAAGSDGSPAWHAVKGRWEIGGGGYNETTGDGDCASLLDRPQDGSYRLEAEFELTGGDPAMGLVFSSSSFDNISYAQMVRFDGESTILTGYFENGEFTAEQSGASPVPVALHQRHLLAVAVDRSEGEYSIAVDGSPVFRHLPLYYPSGFPGLDNTGGSVRFLKVNLTPLSSKRAGVDFSWLRSIAIDRGGNFLLPTARDSVVMVVSSTGELIKTIGVPASRGGQLHRPEAVAAFGDGTCVVSDAVTNRIHRFDAGGTWLGSFGGPGAGKGQFSDPAALARFDDSLIAVADRGNNRVQLFSTGGTSRGVFGSDLLSFPSAIAVDGNQLWVLSSGRSRIEKYRWDGVRALHEGTIAYGGGEGRGLAIHGQVVYLSLVNAVRAYDTSGAFLREFRGRSIGFIHPNGLAVNHERGTLWLADYFYGRLVGLTADLADPEPAFTAIGVDRGSVSFPAAGAASPRLVVTDGADTVPLSPVRTGTHSATFELKNLRSGTTYHASFTPAVLTVPPTRQLSRPYAFTTLSGPRRHQFSRIRLLALIFTDVHDTDSRRPPGRGEDPLPDSETGRIVRQLHDAVRFYWVHSGMRFFIDLDTIVVRDSVRRSDLFGTEWWYPPKGEMLRRQVEKRGRKVTDYASFLYLSCTRRYDTTLHRDMLAGKGGAFTNGVGTGKGYGISWWDVTRANHNAGNNWLMVHEFNHQLDDIFMVSGYPEYWFNHISPTIGTAGRFGEHFDANATIIGMVPWREWLDLRYTSIASAGDRDGDGIPDNDPRLPLDEVRFGSDSTLVDTDGDGVTDADEVKNSGWITEGWGETAGPLVAAPDPRSVDSDRDGLRDNRDPFPCWPVVPVIHRLNTPGDSLPLFARMERGAAPAEVRAAWSADSLVLNVTTPRAAGIKIMIDGDNDGWFLGDRNILCTVTPADSGVSVTVKTQLFVATDPSQWPHMDDSLARLIRPSVTRTGASRGAQTVRIAFPANGYLGLQWNEGAVIGLNIGIQATIGADGSRRYIDLYEPNRLAAVTLHK